MFDEKKSESPDIFISQYTPCAYIYWGVFTGAYITTPFYEIAATHCATRHVNTT